MQSTQILYIANSQSNLHKSPTNFLPSPSRHCLIFPGVDRHSVPLRHLEDRQRQRAASPESRPSKWSTEWKHFVFQIVKLRSNLCAKNAKKKNKAKADFIIEAPPAPSLPRHLVFLPHVLHMQMRQQQQQQHELSTLRSTGNNPPVWPQGN